jgi:hypothetical protein
MPLNYEHKKRRKAVAVLFQKVPEMKSDNTFRRVCIAEARGGLKILGTIMEYSIML